jgi:dihydrofolate reductase
MPRGWFDVRATSTYETEAVMGNIVITEFISLDGVVEDPGGSEKTPYGGWTFTFDRGDRGDRFKLEELQAAEAQLLGRVTYEGFAAAWPSYEDEQGFAEKMNSMPKYVVSSTLQNAGWTNSTILSGDALEEVTALKDRVDGNILVAGSVQLAHLLIQHDLVDEYRLMVFPVVLGAGKRLFPQEPREAMSRLSIVSSDRSGDVEMIVLRPQR